MCILNTVFSRQLKKKDIQDIFDGKQRNKERRDELRANSTAFCRMHFFSKGQFSLKKKNYSEKALTLHTDNG